ncbi:MAG: DUF4129 domain-containing protein [Planctomycetota bacterium]|nr:MAG: DUF4129 domain-containing protein [Planctomycetota bacterium]
MATTRPRQSLADYVTIALSPLLIMALVGSLVFFLLEILYVGQYSGRLQWTLFCFVFAMVLIARISIEQGYERAGLYGIALAVAVFLALQAFVEYPEGSPMKGIGWAINAGLMALIWWCAHRLTWDCTHIDEKVDASGKGVLEAAGLDREAENQETPPPDAADKDIKHKKAGFVVWLDRYRRYRQEQLRKPHTPGVWVVYFSLAALPLFGLGQALIPVEEEERRLHAFWLMVYYVASGLGLLLTTSFLGLRRYLRQRKLKMPVAMTSTWLLLGGTIIVVLMLVGALLPRPYGEYRLLDFTPLGSRERDASDYAVKRDSAGKGQGQSSTDTGKKDQKAESGSGTKPDADDGSGQKSDKSGSGKSGKGSSGSGNQKGGDQGGKGGSKSKQSRDDARSEDKQSEQKEDRNGEKPKDQDEKKDQSDAKTDGEKKAERSGGSSSSGERAKSKSSQRRSGGSSAPSDNFVSRLFSKLGWLGTVLKWIVFTVVAVIVLFFVLRSGLRFLANFTDWARRLLAMLSAWWAGLFGGKGGAEMESAAATAERKARPRPFASFHNPFLDGSAQQQSPEEVVRYSFEALHSWAWERGLGRQPEETPIEFADRLVQDFPAMDTQTRRLASLYARVAYAHGRLTPASLGAVKEFWDRLQAVEEKPLSA